MSTLPLGRALELMDWIGLAGVGLNLLMLTLAQNGKADKKGKKPWAADRPVPVRRVCVCLPWLCSSVATNPAR
jgi:hypothetical protein